MFSAHFRRCSDGIWNTITSCIFAQIVSSVTRCILSSISFSCNRVRVRVILPVPVPGTGVSFKTRGRARGRGRGQGWGRGLFFGSFSFFEFLFVFFSFLFLNPNSDFSNICISVASFGYLHISRKWKSCDRGSGTSSQTIHVTVIDIQTLSLFQHGISVQTVKYRS